MAQNNIDYLRKKLIKHIPRVDARYGYYNMKKLYSTYSFTIPAHIQAIFWANLGWTTKSVDTLADRLIFREFSNDIFDLNEIFTMNNPDTFYDSAILSALIASCCFVYISEDEDGYPRLQVLQANEATGIIDTTTGLLKEGYAVLEKDEFKRPKVEQYFEPFKTTIINSKDRTVKVYDHNSPAPLLVPIVNRPDAERPFGRSRISRASIYWQAYAGRVLERSDVTAEFYSWPQKYVVGTSQDSDPLDSWKATISSMLEFTKDEDGDKPVLGQFNAPSMSPFMEQIRMAAAGFAGETGLTIDDLGFVTDNPSSAEAIKAAHETLRVTARKAQRNFASGFLNVGYLAACIRDDYPYKRNQFYKSVGKWEPIFEPDAATISSIGDGVIKINQSVPGYFGKDNLRDLTGLEGDVDEVGYFNRIVGETSNRIQEGNQSSIKVESNQEENPE
ncbi:phage portal protein [Facklamia hominis]|uniref:phage portal protein n=1 Tax=Facklamia hominis TaxID=178214 RepID=UPI000C7E7A91|nr:phage portal protein [Facklamia hominis]PKY92994.1 hypothetical protein CYJ56_04960 [Facklamia hominis]